jgi:hypothetical protein
MEVGELEADEHDPYSGEMGRYRPRSSILKQQYNPEFKTALRKQQQNPEEATRSTSKSNQPSRNSTSSKRARVSTATGSEARTHRRPTISPHRSPQTVAKVFSV